MDSRAPPQLVGRYAIYGKIAAGGMASVHFGRLAGAAGFSRTVAVKRLHAHLAEDPEFRSTMIDEARLAARIHHPNVVPTLDIVAANGELLLIMEYVRGESLARLLRLETARCRRVPLQIASAIVIGALHGLHAAHEATSDRGAPLGIVHRDVSPQNILVGLDGVARVIDFGVAKAAGRLQTTSEGAIKGKVAYMAPEQLAAGDTRLATGEVTRAADIYAVGALFWEMLTGRRLFPGESDARRALQVLIGAKDPPSRHAHGVSPQLDALIMRALALDPADRFASAREMAEKLLCLVPPAFSTEVGEWVEDVASDSLARRGAELAEIESFSDAMMAASFAAEELGPTTGRAPPSSGVPVVAVTGPEDVQTVSSQPSTLSVEAPRGGAASLPRPWRARVAGALGGTLLLAAGVATFLSRGATSDRTLMRPLPAVASASVDVAVVPASASAPPASAPSVAAAIPIEEAAPPAAPTESRSPAASARPSPPSFASATPGPPAARPILPARSRPRSRPAPKAPPPFRFAQPD